MGDPGISTPWTGVGLDAVGPCVWGDDVVVWESGQKAVVPLYVPQGSTTKEEPPPPPPLAPISPGYGAEGMRGAEHRAATLCCE